MKRNTLFIIAVCFLISCAGSPSNEKSEFESEPIILDTVTINIPGHILPFEKVNNAEILYFPLNKIYALRFTYRECLYYQYYDAEAREKYIDSLSRFIHDQNTGTLKGTNLRARQIYGGISGYTAYENPRYYGSFITRPEYQFGYLYLNSRAFFSVTQGEAQLEGYPEKSRFTEDPFSVYFDNKDAEKLAYIFSYDPSPIVCFGDNVTSGYSAGTRGIVDKAKAYPAFVQEKVSVPVINSGGGWETTDRALKRLDSDVLAYDPQMVIIAFGANDFSGKIPAYETKKNLEEMINRISNGKRKIYIVQFYTRERLNSLMWDWGYSADEKRDFIQGYDDMYSDLSLHDNVEVIRNAWDNVWGENMSSDYNNPVVDGQKIMADNIISSIKPFLLEHRLLTGKLETESPLASSELFLETSDNEVTVPNNKYAPDSIVCFGDNVTSGYSAVTRGNVDNTKAYPAYLQAKISVPVINSGGGWETTDRALRRLDSDVLAYDPQMVIIAFGANDFSNKTSAQETQKNLEEMVRQIGNGKRKIFIVQFYTRERLYSMMWDWGMSSDERRIFIQDYDDMYSALSKLDNVEVIKNAWDNVWGVHMSSDYNNPVAAGQEIMALNIFNSIKPFLEEHSLIK